MTRSEFDANNGLQAVAPRIGSTFHVPAPVRTQAVQARLSIAARILRALGC